VNKNLLRHFSLVIRDGLALWWLAPIIPLIAVCTEFYQHYGEVTLGMFDSEEAFSALATSPERLRFGIWKITGVLIALSGAAQFWSNRKYGEPWWSMRVFLHRKTAIAWVLNLVIFGLIALLIKWVGLDSAILPILAMVIVTLPVLLYTSAALFGDDSWSLKRSFTAGWKPLLRMSGFMLAVLIPFQVIHVANHHWAFGASDILLWVILVFDSLLVGLLATLAGTALHHGLYSFEHIES
jgi:hypothetical protein